MSKIEVDTIEPQSGTTLTLGASGDSVNIASGATITDFTSTGIDDNATSTAITIDSSENVGIGTTSPGQKLDIGSGTLRIKNASGDSSGLMLFQDTGDVSVINNYYAGAIAFQVNSTERVRIDSSGNLKFNSGYGSVATAYGCRAWVNFNGTGTVAIRESGNVTSITDHGTGDYTVNFTTAMPDANYAVTGMSRNIGGTGGFYVELSSTSAPTTSSYRIFNFGEVGVGLRDGDFMMMSVFR